MNRFAITLASATALAAALVAAAPVGAHAEALSTGQRLLILDGVAFRGSAVCNQSWLDRPGAKSILDQAVASNANPDGSEAFIKRGMTDFDNPSHASERKEPVSRLTTCS